MCENNLQREHIHMDWGRNGLPPLIRKVNVRATGKIERNIFQKIEKRCIVWRESMLMIHICKCGEWTIGWNSLQPLEGAQMCKGKQR